MSPAPLAEVHYKLVWNLTELGRMLGMPRSTIEKYVVDADDNPAAVGKPADGPRWVRLFDPPVRIPAYRDHNGHLKFSADAVRPLISGRSGR